MKCYAKSSENLIVQLANLPPKPPFLSKSFHLFSCTGKTHYLCISSAKNKEQNKTFLPFNFQNIGRQLVQYAASGSYALYPHEKYVAAWSVEAKFGSESFFEIANSVDDTPGRDSWGYLLNWYGYQKGFVTQKYAEQMLADPGDVRGQLLEENKYAGKTVWWLYKLRGTDLKTAPLECNNVVLRLSEVYLIAAEAGCKLGGDAAVQGLGYLNEIVKRGNPDNEVTMADYTLDRVLDERSKELVGEGHRFFDLLRNGKTIVRKGGYHLPSVDEEVDWDFYKCVLPIPEDQFIFSPEMEQNPGYPKN